MMSGVLKLVMTLFMGLAIAIPVNTSVHAEVIPTKAENVGEAKEKNCIEKMEMMKKEMKVMMENHEMMKKEMNSLFNDLQESGKLTQEQIQKLNSIKQMMRQMEEKMKHMSSMETDELK
uniref:Uncharacterized protein n=2 Tax=Virgibacillus oceani TaxID=1479511 RepID=A0A917GYV2_9BACI|nr:hypothetical protein GCM10011398_00270 [Virgibacillus oceani]